MKKLIKIFNSLGCVSEIYEGMATIFMLHRVNELKPRKLHSNDNLKISPEYLNNFIIELKNNGYEFISMDELYSVLKTGKKVSKKIVITLDDGYKDNYNIAYPIFKKHNVPFTIYITTSFPDQNSILWWYLLEDLVIKEDEVCLKNGQKFKCLTREQKEFSFLKIREIILKLDKDDFVKDLNYLFGNYDINWHSKNKELTINWKEIIELSNDKLCTIGSHTENHFALNKLSEIEVIEEILNAKTRLESKIQKKVEHFAYPFGSENEVGQREFDIIKALGLKTTTTTRRGNIRKKHVNYLECLPRIMLTEDFKINEIGKIQRNIFVTK